MPKLKMFKKELTRKQMLYIEREMKKFLKKEEEFYQKRIDSHNRPLPILRLIVKRAKKKDPNYKAHSPLRKWGKNHFRKERERFAKIHRRYLIAMLP